MHFYEQTKSGVEPRHFVPMKSRPDLRPTRITDVRKWWKEGRYVVPSVTTVLNVLNKAALNNWKVDQHLYAAYQLDQASYECEHWVKLAKELAELEMDKAPTAGTNLHKLMEEFVNHDMPPEHEWWSFCHSVYWEIECATEFKNDDGASHYRTEVNFAKYGYGGQVDLVIADDWLIDYKTKQTAEKFKPGKMAYDEHPMQLAAYRNGLDMPNARCANVFVCLEDGQVDFHEHPEEDLKRGYEMFQHALALWQLQNNVETK